MEGAVHSSWLSSRRSVVHQALNWLVTYNQYYRSNHVHIDVNALEQLPHDGNLSQLTAITVESAITEPPATNTPVTGPPVADTPATSEDPYSAHLPQSSVPFATRSMTEQEAVHQSVQERQLSPSTSSSPATMMWPLLEEYPSMSSPPRATSPVHFPHSSLPVREISQGNARIRLPLATTSSIWWCMTTIVLLNTHVSASSPSTLRCDGVHFRPAEYTSSNTLVMPSCH